MRRFLACLAAIRITAQGFVIVGLLWTLAALGNTALFAIAGARGAPDPEAWAKWGEVAGGVPWMLLLCLCVLLVTNQGPRRPMPGI